MAQVRTGTIVEHQPSAGLVWTYYTYVPRTVRRITPVVLCQGYRSEEIDNYGLTREGARQFLRTHTYLAERYGCYLFSLAVPSDIDWFGSMLSRASLTDLDGQYWRRPDLEMIRALNQFKVELRRSGYRVADRIMIAGASAGGKFAPRFAFLHPNLVEAAGIIASPGSPWPLAELQGQRLTYPLGVDDLRLFTGRPFSLTLLRHVRFKTFLGALDTNDCLTQQCWTSQQLSLLLSLFGTTPRARAAHFDRTMRSVGLSSRLAVYPGLGHSLSPELCQDVFEFLFPSASGSN